jgi:hypothetical protein
VKAERSPLEQLGVGELAAAPACEIGDGSTLAAELDECAEHELGRGAVASGDLREARAPFAEAATRRL